MVDNEIIKALECCGNIVDSTCKKCVYHETYNASCVVHLMRDALDLINRQKAEIENLKKFCNDFSETLSNNCKKADLEKVEAVDKAKSEAYREFAKKLRGRAFKDGTGFYICVIDQINKLEEELTDQTATSVSLIDGHIEE